MSDDSIEQEHDWEQIRAGQRELDEHRRTDYIRRAAEVGVTLTSLPWDEHPGLNLGYLSPDGVNEVHLRWLGDGWRMSEVATLGTYDRSWRYGLDGFDRMVLALEVWRGARDREPVGWLKRDKGNAASLLELLSSLQLAEVLGAGPTPPTVEIVIGRDPQGGTRWAVLDGETVFVTLNGKPVVRITSNDIQAVDGGTSPG